MYTSLKILQIPFVENIICVDGIEATFFHQHSDLSTVISGMIEKVKYNLLNRVAKSLSARILVRNNFCEVLSIKDLQRIFIIIRIDFQ